MSYRFQRDESVPEAVARTADEQLRTAEGELTEGIDRDPVEAVHTARKAIKKERALLRLVRKSISRSERRRLNASLRAAGRKLSATRDAEVLVKALDDLHERFAGQVPVAAFTAFRSHLEDERARARARLDDRDLTPAVARDLARIRGRIEGWQLRSEGWDALGGGLARSYRRGRRAFRRAQSEPSMENLHEWRKRTKDLWYHLRLVAPVGGHGVKGQSKDAHILADLLGDDHDLAVLRQALLTHGAQVPADLDALLGLIDHRRDQLQDAAMLAGERVYAERPKAFTRRLRHCWHAGQARQETAVGVG
jgi:CHAD domain-containing protein